MTDLESKLSEWEREAHNDVWNFRKYLQDRILFLISIVREKQKEVELLQKALILKSYKESREALTYKAEEK